MRNKYLGTGEPGYHPIRKFKTIVSGLRYAVLTDFSVAYKLVASLVILGAAFGLRKWVDFAVILLATGMVLVAEMFNTTIEALCDFVEPRHSHRIKAIKDTAAAAVGICIFIWIVVLAVELSHLLPLLLSLV